jgi:ATP-binding cassette subfamily A (ABC1) protein 3
LPGVGGDWEYTIRMNCSSEDWSGKVPETTGKTVRTGTSRFDGSDYHDGEARRYTTGGFLATQLMMDRYIINVRVPDGLDSAAILNKQGVQLDPLCGPSSWENGSSSWENGSSSWENGRDRDRTNCTATLAEPGRYLPTIVDVAGMPEEGKVTNGFYSNVVPVLGMLFILGFMYSSYGLMTWLITEKETKIRESLKMMGVQTSSLLASFYGLHGAVFGMVMAIFTVFLTGFGIDIAVFPNSDLLLLFLFFWLWSMSFVAFAFAFHTLFNKAMVGGIVGALVMLSQFVLVRVVTLNESVSTFGVWLMALLPNCALVLGVEIVADFEALKEGVGFGNLFAHTNSGIAFGTLLLTLMWDIVMWTALGWYLEKVLPKEFGVRLPPWFCFLPSFWTGRDPAADDGAIAAPSPAPHDDESVESVSSSLKCLVDIRGLRKVFGSKVALKQLNLQMYQGQVFCLLGHNGAGKTTTMNMLTGMLSPTSGSASIQGLDIETQMVAIRKTIGCCPQHDILWEQLTVHQHLETFARLKGLDPATCVAAKIAEVGLTEKVLTKAGELSGGMKRKLSLCMALIGEPTVVFLDEPTSGMDPFSRRSTWNMLQSSRAGRAMVLTTHFMDEVSHVI